MITRKISAALVIINYLLHFVKAIICLPYEIKAFGKSGNENYEIFKFLLTVSSRMSYSVKLLHVENLSFG